MMPRFIQNIMISIFGYYQKYKRYGGSIGRQVVEFDRKICAMDKKELDAFRVVKVNEILACAWEYKVYQDLFNRKGFKKRYIESIDELYEIPFLEKPDIKRLSTEVKEKEKSYFESTTSGSTGTPLVVHNDEFTYKLAMYLLRKLEKKYIIDSAGWIATFAGRMITKNSDNEKYVYRKNHAIRQLLFSSYDLSTEKANRYIEALEKYRPKQIIGYSSSIYLVSKLYIEKGIEPGFRPKLILSNSEPLLDYQIKTIESVFKVRPIDYYSSAENAFFCYKGIDGSYISEPSISIIEKYGREEVGDLIVTCITNKSMPIIRYRIGDLIKGEGQGIIEGFSEVYGRNDDVVVTNSGVKIGRLDHIYKGVPGIVEAQIIQKRRGVFMIKVVEERGFDVDTSKILDQMYDRIGKDNEVVIEKVTDISKGANGKFKGVIVESDRF